MYLIGWLYSFVSCGTGSDNLEHPLEDPADEGEYNNLMFRQNTEVKPRVRALKYSNIDKCKSIAAFFLFPKGLFFLLATVL